MVFIENTGLIPHHISTIHQQGLSNGLFLHPLPYHWSSHLCHCRNFTTSTGSLMRLAKFPVDSTPSTKRTERESKSMIGGWRGGEEKYKKKGQESTGEWRGFLSRAGINRTPGTARSEPGSPESTYHRGPPMLVTARQGPLGDSQGYTSQMRGSIHHARWLKGRRSGWLGRKRNAIMPCFENLLHERAREIITSSDTFKINLGINPHKWHIPLFWKYYTQNSYAGFFLGSWIAN